MLTSIVMISLIALAQHVHQGPATEVQAGATSSLTAEAVQQLLDGEGMGLARSAELNEYPGPKHVLDLETALALTPDQRRQVEEIRARMLAAATPLGRRIVDAERALDTAFRSGRITETALAEHLGVIGRLQGELRSVHLRAHVLTKPVLTAGQIRRYYELRSSGASGGPRP
jgi:hypothetical protein